MDAKYRNIPLNPLRAFAIASQHQTFTAAANHMGVSQVAISRQIATLEDYLGITLFERNVRSVKLTDVGRSFSAEISHHFEEIERLTERLFTVDGENTIDMRVYPTFAHQWLIPKLNDFGSAYPDYKIRLDTKVEPLDFRGTHIDLALQLGHGIWSDAKSRKLFDEVIDVVCSPEYATRLDNLANPDALQDATLLHAKYRRVEWQIWVSEAGVNFENPRGTEFDSSLLVYAAAKQGLGLAIGQLNLLQKELESGALVRPFKKPHKTGLAFYLVWPTVKSVSTNTRRLTDWLLDQAGEQPEFFKRKQSSG